MWSTAISADSGREMQFGLGEGDEVPERRGGSLFSVQFHQKEMGCYRENDERWFVLRLFFLLSFARNVYDFKLNFQELLLKISIFKLKFRI